MFIAAGWRNGGMAEWRDGGMAGWNEKYRQNAGLKKSILDPRF